MSDIQISLLLLIGACLNVALFVLQLRWNRRLEERERLIEAARKTVQHHQQVSQQQWLDARELVCDLIQGGVAHVEAVSGRVREGSTAGGESGVDAPTDS